MAVKKNGKLDEDRETYNGREASPVLQLALAPRIVHRNIGKTKYSFVGNTVCASVEREISFVFRAN